MKRWFSRIARSMDYWAEAFAWALIIEYARSAAIEAEYRRNLENRLKKFTGES